MKIEITDDAMSPLLNRGDIVEIDKDAHIGSNDIALVSGKHENGNPFQLIRRVYIHNGYMALIADNKDNFLFEPIIQLYRDLCLLGKVTKIFKRHSYTIET